MKLQTYLNGKPVEIEVKGAMKPAFYMLNEQREVVPVDDRDWRWLPRENDDDPGRVAQDSIGEVKISTVFLGINYRPFDEGLPLVFETMIFGGEFDQMQEHYATWGEAEAGHRYWAEKVRESESRPTRRLRNWLRKTFGKAKEGR